MFQLCTTLALAPLLAASAMDDVSFEPPVEIKAGDKDYSGVLYPSPVLYDLDGDGTDELIIGDLRGFLQSASRISSDGNAAWGPSANIKATDGKDLKFHNW